MSNVALLAVLAALLVGGGTGALLVWISCARRMQTQQALRDQLQGAFGDMARNSLQSNNEIFLQLAAERLARQQQSATQALSEREVAIGTLVQPLREALSRSEAQIQQLESARVGA